MYYIDEEIRSYKKWTLDPLLEISNETILCEQLKDKEIAVIYDSILKGHQPKSFKAFSICPATKLLLHFNHRGKHHRILRERERNIGGI